MKGLVRLPVVQPECRDCFQCRDGILTGVSDQVRGFWNKAKLFQVVPRGTLLFQEGEPSAGLYCVSEGWIKLFRSGADGNLQIVRLAGPTDILGHRSLLAGEPLNATAGVIEEATVCFVDRETVLESVRRDVRLAMNLMACLARSLGTAEARLQAVARCPIEARVAGLVLELAGPTRDEIPVSLTREEMGQIVGTTLESVSRSLRALAARGVLRAGRQSIAILDRPALERAATWAG